MQSNLPTGFQAYRPPLRAPDIAGNVRTAYTGGASASVPQARLEQGQAMKFGWTSLDGVDVPFIRRGNDRYVSVKMVEAKILSKFPKIMDNMTNVGPIYSYYITDSEAKLLTDINTQFCNLAFGTKPFTTKDLIVSLESFLNFYTRAKKHFESQHHTDNAHLQISGGWVQINNTIVPYLHRGPVKFVPLSVIKYAAGLLTDIRMDGHKVPCTEEEYVFLNNCCNSARINFTFSIKTKLIKLDLIAHLSQSKVNIVELPKQDPFAHAQYQFDVTPPPASAGAQSYLLPVMQPAKAQPNISPPNVSHVTSINHMTGVSGGASVNHATGASHVYQSAPPRNPFIYQNHRLPSPAVSPAPPAYMQRAQLPYAHTISPVPSAQSVRDLGTPSPSISPRTQSIASRQARGSRSNSSTPNSRPPSTQSASSITPPNLQPPPALLQDQFSLIPFRGNRVSCILRGEAREPYALLEALVQLYFPHLSVASLQSILTSSFGIFLEHITPDEELAFIRFYDLNVSSLNSKTIISFNLFRTCFDKLSKALGTVERTSKARRIVSNEPIVINDEASNDVEQVSRKRSSSSAAAAAAGGTKKPKQVCKRLEDTVAKLRLRQDVDTAHASDSDSLEERVEDVASKADALVTAQINGSQSIETNDMTDECAIDASATHTSESPCIENEQSVDLTTRAEAEGDTSTDYNVHDTCPPTKNNHEVEKPSEDSGESLHVVEEESDDGDMEFNPFVANSPGTSYENGLDENGPELAVSCQKPCQAESSDITVEAHSDSTSDCLEKQDRAASESAMELLSDVDDTSLPNKNSKVTYESIDETMSSEGDVNNQTHEVNDTLFTTCNINDSCKTQAADPETSSSTCTTSTAIKRSTILLKDQQGDSSYARTSNEPNCTSSSPIANIDLVGQAEEENNTGLLDNDSADGLGSSTEPVLVVNTLTEPSNNLNPSTEPANDVNSSAEPTFNCVNIPAEPYDNLNTSTEPANDVNSSAEPSNNLNTEVCNRVNIPAESHSVNTLAEPAISVEQSHGVNTLSEQSYRLDASAKPSNDVHTSAEDSSDSKILAEPTSKVPVSTEQSTGVSNSAEPKNGLNNVVEPVDDVYRSVEPSNTMDCSDELSAIDSTEQINNSHDSLEKLQEVNSSGEQAYQNTNTYLTSSVLPHSADSTDKHLKVNISAEPSTNINKTEAINDENTLAGPAESDDIETTTNINILGETANGMEIDSEQVNETDASTEPVSDVNSSIIPSTEPGNDVNNSTEHSTESSNGVNSSTEPSTEPANDVNNSTEASFEPVSNVNNSTEPSTEPANKVNSSIEPVSDVNISTVPSTEPVSDVNNSTEASFEPVSNVNNSNEPSTELVSGVNSGTEPSTEPVTYVNISSELSAEPVCGVNSNTEPSTETVNDVNSGTEPSTEPVNNVNNHTEPSTEPVNDVNNHTEPSTEPVNDVNNHAEPSTAPVSIVNSSTEPVNDVNNSAESSFEPVNEALMNLMETSTEPVNDTASSAEAINLMETSTEPVNDTASSADAIIEPGTISSPHNIVNSLFKATFEDKSLAPPCNYTASYSVNRSEEPLNHVADFSNEKSFNGSSKINVSPESFNAGSNSTESVDNINTLGQPNNDVNISVVPNNYERSSAEACYTVNDFNKAPMEAPGKLSTDANNSEEQSNTAELSNNVDISTQSQSNVQGSVEPHDTISGSDDTPSNANISAEPDNTVNISTPGNANSSEPTISASSSVETHFNVQGSFEPVDGDFSLPKMASEKENSCKTNSSVESSVETSNDAISSQKSPN